MLQSMRSSSGSWIAKGILGLLVLSFLGWGIADYAYVGGNQTTVAKVGDREITIYEFTQSYQQMLRARQLQSLDASILEQLNVAESVLQGMASRVLYEEAAQQLDLTASDSMVRDAIQTRPEFTGLTGQFDRNQFNFTLASIGVTEADFVEIQRRELSAETLIGSVVSGSAAPKAMTDLLFDHFGERRSAQYLRLTPKNAPLSFTQQVPTDSDLQSFYEERGDDFRRPELRSLRFVSITPEAVAAEIDIADSELMASFEQRRAEFQQPEQRALSQVVFASEDEARAAESALAGLDSDSVSLKANELGLSVIELGTFARDAIPNPALADAAFTLSSPGVTSAFEGSFGWSLGIVTEIIAGEDPSFEDVAEELRTDLALAQAYNDVAAIGSALEDAYGSGSTLADAAAELGLDAVVVEAVDDLGRNPSGQMLTNLPTGQSFLRTAFQLEEGDVSFLETSESNGLFMVEVIAVTPSAIPPLEQVRPAVLEAWQEDTTLMAVEELAEAYIERLANGDTITALGTEAGLAVTSAEGFTRDGQSIQETSLPGILVQDLFESDVGEGIMAVDGENIYVARLTDIQPARDSNEDASQLENGLISALTEGMEQDIIQQWGQALESQITVETFPSVYNQVYQY